MWLIKWILIEKKTHTMQNNCAGLIISYPFQQILSSIQAAICACVQIILWTVSVYCAYFCDLMYSMKIRLQNKKHQMYGRLHCVNLKSGIFMRKHFNNKKNFCWHHHQSNHFVCDKLRRTSSTAIRSRQMWNTMSVIMSGKCDCIHRMAKILGEHVT